MSTEEDPPLYYSRISNKLEPDAYFYNLINLLTQFAVSIDQCSQHNREIVWSQISSLYNRSCKPPNDLFSPLVAYWKTCVPVDLVAVEIFYAGFIQAQASHPSLLAVPSKDSAAENRFTDEDYACIKRFESIWKTDMPARLKQFSVLLHWIPVLEKLSPNLKETIWNTCLLFPMFAEERVDRTSFRSTLLRWAYNPAKHHLRATILFAALGILRDREIIKHEFFYPGTNTPVFTNRDELAEDLAVHAHKTAQKIAKIQALTTSVMQSTPSSIKRPSLHAPTSVATPSISNSSPPQQRPLSQLHSHAQAYTVDPRSSHQRELPPPLLRLPQTVSNSTTQTSNSSNEHMSIVVREPSLPHLHTTTSVQDLGFHLAPSNGVIFSPVKEEPSAEIGSMYNTKRRRSSEDTPPKNRMRIDSILC